MKASVFAGVSIVAAFALAAPGVRAQCSPLFHETQLLRPGVHSFASAFGYAVAVDGTVMTVGLPNAGQYQGYVRVYELRDDRWVHVQDLTAPDGVYSSFGAAVDVSGGTIVVGDPLFDKGEGAVWVFEHDGSAWIPHPDNPLQSRLSHPDAAFGYSVAISGQTFVVGAPGLRYDNGAGDKTLGLAFLYTPSGNAWREGPLVPNAYDYGETRFGHAVTIDGGIVAVGAPDAASDDGEAQAGRVTIYEETTSWYLTKRLQPADLAGGDRFGFSVAIAGHDVVVGAPYQQNRYAGGAAYAYERDATRSDTYYDRGKLVPDAYCTGGYTQGFGYDVALHDDDLVIGSPHSGPDLEGEAFVYERSGSRWNERAVYGSSTYDRQDQVGFAVDVSGGVSVLGAPYYGTHYEGAALVFDEAQLGGKKQEGGSADGAASAVPHASVLSPNYPNPFNPSTVIRYTLAAEAHVTLQVYDLTGRLVRTLVDAKQPAGLHAATFEAGSLPSGTYLYRLRAGTFAEARLMTLVR